MGTGCLGDVYRPPRYAPLFPCEARDVKPDADRDFAHSPHSSTITEKIPQCVVRVIR